MKLFLVRHGETDANACLGHSGLTPSDGDGTYEIGEGTDVPLNSNGLLQAQTAALKLPEKLNAIYSSPLLRALDTARIIAREKHIPEEAIVVSPALKEYTLGSLDGKLHDEILRTIGENVQNDALHCSYDYRKYGGEWCEDVRDRVATFIEFLKKQHKDQTVVVVTSGGVIRMATKILLADIAPSIYSKIKIKNGSVHEYNLP